MEYFQVRYDSRVVIYECKMLIRLATGYTALSLKPLNLKDMTNELNVSF